MLQIPFRSTGHSSNSQETLHTASVDVSRYQFAVDTAFEITGLTYRHAKFLFSST